MIDDALAAKRSKLAGAWYVFGNLDGQKYTEGAGRLRWPSSWRSGRDSIPRPPA